MRFSLLLLALSWMLKRAAGKNKAFQQYISQATVRVLIKTADAKYARLFSFKKGNFSSVSGDCEDFDVALVWKDAGVGFSVMTDKSKDASFNAAAEGKLRVEGMSVYAQWFEEGMKLVM